VTLIAKKKDLALLMAGYIQFPDVPAVQLFSIWQRNSNFVVS
jgi:hypothetical protein